jgi:hypothetical protein
MGEGYADRGGVLHQEQPATPNGLTLSLPNHTNSSLASASYIINAEVKSKARMFL